MEEKPNKETIEKEYKFICEKCNYKTDIKSRMEKHLKSELHKEGKKKKRSDYKGEYKCEKCEYNSKNKYNYKTHILNNHMSKEEKEKEFKYYCKYCDIGTYSKDFMDKHNLTIKHQYIIIKKEI